VCSGLDAVGVAAVGGVATPRPGRPRQRGAPDEISPVRFTDEVRRSGNRAAITIRFRIPSEWMPLLISIHAYTPPTASDLS
jgi:hypothetical protein